MSNSTPRCRASRLLNVFDGFCGCGGFSEGFVQAGGFEVTAACEWDPEHPAIARTYEANCPRASMVNADIRLPDTRDRICACFRDKPCDVAIGGIPCKAYTKSKHRDPNDPRGRLYEPFLDLVGRLAPLAVVIENVPDLLTYRHADGSLAAHRISARLRSLGYAVVSRVLNAADFGVAQRRRRVFIFAWRQGTIPRPVRTHDEHGRGGLPKWRSIKDAIGDIEDAPDDEAWSHVFPRHGREVLDRIRATPVGGKASVGFNEGAYRDAPDRPSRTLRGGAWIVHYRHDRVITAREAARLQGFPDEFVFLGAKAEVTLQIGNAVPPPLAKGVALAVLGALGAGRPEPCPWAGEGIG